VFSKNGCLTLIGSLRIYSIECLIFFFYALILHRIITITILHNKYLYSDLERSFYEFYPIDQIMLYLYYTAWDGAARIALIKMRFIRYIKNRNTIKL